MIRLLKLDSGLTSYQAKKSRHCKTQQATFRGEVPPPITGRPGLHQLVQGMRLLIPIGTKGTALLMEAGLIVVEVQMKFPEQDHRVAQLSTNIMSH